MSIYTKKFAEINKNDTLLAGGKGASLGEMTQAGIPVPEGYIVVSVAFQDFFKESGIAADIESILSKVDQEKIYTIETASEQIQAIILQTAMSPSLQKEIEDAFLELNTKFVAVRSSATAEDGINAAWAGQLDTFLNTTKETLLANVKHCWASLFSPRAIFYRIEKNLHKEEIAVAVVVQKMIQSEVSGVAFSVHPVTQDRNQILIEAGYGLGEAVVSGAITPDNYVIEKNTLNIFDKYISNQDKQLVKNDNKNEWIDVEENKQEQQKLSDDKIQELSKLIVKIENHYGFPCDIEWGLFENKLYILQSRPITTLQTSQSETKKEIDQSELYKTQISLTEWLKNIGHKDTEELREEDNEKRERLRVLNEIIGLPFDKPTQFEAIDLANKTSAVFDFVKQHKDESCALRLIPIVKGVEKLRMRGMTVEAVFNEWFPTQKIDPANYRAEFISNATQTHWATIFVTNEKGIFGEIIRDGHFVLTQGFYNKAKPITFHYDWKNWKLEPEDTEAQEHLTLLIGKLKVNQAQEEAIKKEMDADFAKGYLAGYFETVDTEFGIQYIDYSAKLGRLFGGQESKPATGELKGQIFGKGRASGRVKIVDDPKAAFETGDILVCDMTTPAYIELMKKSAAIITNQGGILSHAAIIARELGKICVVGTGNATSILKDEDVVEVDATNGVVRLISTSLPFQVQNYQRLFRANDAKLWLSDFFMQHYKTLECVCFQDENTWWSFLPKYIVERTLNDGVELYTNIEKFDAFEKDFLQYLKEATQTLSHILTLKSFAKSDLEQFVQVASHFWFYFSKTEFFYTDKAYQDAADKVDVKRYEYLKNTGREFLNHIFFEPDGYVAQMFEKLSRQFDVSLEDLGGYSLHELIELFEGKQILTVDLKQRSTYITCAQHGEVEIITGESAKKLITDFWKQKETAADTVKGSVANKGHAEGRARVIKYEFGDFQGMKKQIGLMQKGEILIAETTSPEYMIACKLAAAIITDQGGLMTHAAIVSRELGIPCIVATENATDLIQTGDLIHVDAHTGVVTILEKSNT